MLVPALDLPNLKPACSGIAEKTNDNILLLCNLGDRVVVAGPSSGTVAPGDGCED